MEMPAQKAPNKLDTHGARTEIHGPDAWPDAARGLGHPAMLLVLRIIVGGVLLFAASQKIQAPKAFALSIGAFDLVPRAWIVPLAFLFIWQEIAAGAFLMLGIWTRAAALVAAGLLTVFLGALGWAVVMGLPIDCGCFGGLSAGPIGWESVVRNLLLISAALWVFLKGGGSIAVERLWSRGSSPAPSPSPSPAS